MSKEPYSAAGAWPFGNGRATPAAMFVLLCVASVHLKLRDSAQLLPPAGQHVSQLSTESLR